MRFSAYLLLLPLLLGCTAPEAPAKPRVGWLPAKVVRVVDGDTIHVLLDGRVEKVRLLRVNTPESVHPDRKQNITIGKVASDYTKHRLSGQDAFLEFESPGKPERDKYRRLLAYIRLQDDSNFNLELVERGLSPFYTPYGKGKYADAFKAAEKRARDAGLGIWGDPELREKYLRLKSKWGAGRD